MKCHWSISPYFNVINGQSESWLWVSNKSNNSNKGDFNSCIFDYPWAKTNGKGTPLYV